MVKNLFADFREAARERIRNPFLLSFIVFLLITNWKVALLFFFGDASITERIGQIEKEKLSLWDGVGWPFLESAGFVVVIPWVTYVVQRWQSIPVIKSQRKKLEDETDVAKLRKILYQADVENKKINYGSDWHIKSHELDLEIKRKESEERISLNIERKKFEVERNSLQLKVSELKGERDTLSLDLKEAYKQRAKLEAELNGATSRYNLAESEREMLKARVSSLESLLDQKRVEK